MSYILIFFILLLVEILYFRIANYFNIIDKPNQRSLHTQITIRGGGIIFAIAAFAFFILSDVKYPFFFLALLGISIISFLDDIYTLSSRYRLLIHFCSVLLLIYQISLDYKLEFWLIPILIILLVGIINAYNFMDGINGITGGYSFFNLLFLLYVDVYIVRFIEEDLIIFVSLGVLVFLFFNFRRKAKAFAGDVGSVSIAFIIIYLLLNLIFKTGNYSYILFLAVYGVDTIFTIIVRVVLRENIFQAHNKHLFQLLVSKKRLSHLQVSAIYMTIQILINLGIILISKSSVNLIAFTIITLSSLSLMYTYIRYDIIKIVDNH